MKDAAVPTTAPEVSADPWWVVCLCAGWCGVCRDYRSGFDAVGPRWPDVRWEWLDVEDRKTLWTMWMWRPFPRC
jgi:hypothetical protein